MPERKHTYPRALEILDSLVSAPVQGLHAGPLPLSRLSGLSTTSGYRAVAQAEAAGLLGRGPDGFYRRGLDACRIGLSAHGFGMFAAAAEPVLIRLRQAARMTALLGVVRDGSLMVGPFSMGRGPRYLVPKPKVAIVGQPIWEEGAPTSVQLMLGDGANRVQVALLERLLGNDAGAFAVTGIILTAVRDNTLAELAAQVSIARGRFLQTDQD